MNEIEKNVTEQPEVEQVAEQPVKTYTQEEVDAIVGKRLARQEAKIRKENDRKYGRLTDVLKAGTGKESVEEMTDAFAKFYEGKGIKIRKEPEYTDRDLEVLARAEANEYIKAGYEDVEDELERLAEVGIENMTAREKALFQVLGEHQTNANRSRELTKLGVTEDVYNSKEFKDFASKFNPNTPITDVYDIYAKTKPKKDIQPMGSMKNSESGEKGVKEFYSVEEAKKFSRKELDANPELFKAIERSMLKW
jgi:hypothetical protein